MTKNMNKREQVVRVILGAALAILYLAGVISGWLADVLVIVGAVLVLTGALGFCPLYKLLNISAKK
jgi:hypothetical protein